MSFSLSYYRFTFLVGILMTFGVFSLLYMNENVTKVYFWSFKQMLFPSERPPLIMIWTYFYSLSNSDVAEQLSNVNCPVKCHFTSDGAFLAGSSAIVFHLRSVKLDNFPPQNINLSQKWILINRESPAHTPRNVLERFEGKVHWTVSYRKDSDIYSPYAKLIPIKNPVTEDIQVETEKPDIVCWIVSHCSTSSQREVYAKILNKFLPVVIYGKCGDRKCLDNYVEHCYEHISKTCKFYLSFENSLCKDYATEKLFHALKTGMVPIVMGGANYSSILPEHSYIDILDYDSPEDLANYLLELNNDTEKFRMYHQWRTKYEIMDNVYEIWACEICNKLYEARRNPGNVEVHRGLIDWWFTDANCNFWLPI